MDTAALLGRLLISLAFVLGLMWLLARRAKRGGRGLRGGGAKLVDVLGRQQLSRNSSVAIVRVMDQALILGITDGTVSVIGETDLAAVEAKLDEQAPRRTPRPARPARPARTGQTAGAARPARASRSARASRPARASRSSRKRATAAARPMPATAVAAEALVEAAAPKRGALAGSALSPATWRQTLESLRDLTSRARRAS